MAIIDKLSLKETLKVCDRFVIRRNERLRIGSCKKYGRAVVALLSDKKDVRPSRIYRLLEPLSYEALIFLMAKCGRQLVKQRVADFLRKYNGVRLAIKGADLKKLGMRPGPDFTKILRRTLYAKIDGELKTKKDEISFAKKQAKRLKAKKH